MEQERKHIEKELAVLVYYMQGGLSYTDAYHISLEQMKHLSDAVVEHYEKQNSVMNNMNKSR
jgi:hypothetical protein